MPKYFLSVAAAAILSLTATPAMAGDMAHRTVEQVIEAYGGDKFRNLKSITVTSDLRFGWLGQGKTSGFVELEPMIKIHKIDLQNGRGSEEAWGAGGDYHERVITTEDGQKTVNYHDKVFSDNPEGGFYDHFGGEIRTVDTLIAYDLMKHRDKAEYKGTAYYGDNLHHIIEYDMPGTSFEPKVWVNAKTGLITRMVRTPPAYDVNYVFGNFKTVKGITAADDFALYVDDEMVEYTKSRSIDVNRVRASTFEVDKGIVPEPETLDGSEMSVDKVSEGVYMAGQNNAYSAFIDAGDHWVGVGLYGGLKARYEAVIAAHGDKPLKFMVATHHHQDHVEGTQDALDLGAIIAAPETAKKNIMAQAGSEIAEGRLNLFSGTGGEIGPVKMYMINTPHVANYGLTYIPSAKTIFQGDHYNGRFSGQASYVGKSGAAFYKEAEKLGLDVDYLLSAHARKIESWEAFGAMAEKYDGDICPSNRKICRDLK